MQWCAHVGLKKIKPHLTRMPKLNQDEAIILIATTHRTHAYIQTHVRVFRFILFSPQGCCTINFIGFAS